MFAESFMRSICQYPSFFTCLSFTLRQTPHMSLPLPQVPPPTIDVPQPDPPAVEICNTWLFFVAICNTWLFPFVAICNTWFFPFALTWRLCRDHSWVLAGWCAAPNARVVWFHAGGADVLLHHLQRQLAFSIYATSPGIGKASDDKRAWTLCSIASCTQSCS